MFHMLFLFLYFKQPNKLNILSYACHIVIIYFYFLIYNLFSSWTYLAAEKDFNVIIKNDEICIKRIIQII